MVTVNTKKARGARVASHRQVERKPLVVSREEKLALRTYLKVHRASVSLVSKLSPVLADFGLTLSQFSVLEALHSFGALQQRAIGEKIMKTEGNVTMVVTNLERLGLVTRERLNKRQRDLTVFPTPAGEELITAAFGAFKKAVAIEMSVLSSDEKATLGELCRRLGRQGRPG